ncbi:hypothetical protein [Bradyrhizobium sp. USDA 241]|uniref:AbiU2 domain-containing protein n=1 Tax=Bradyrhizobium sp. USDA 241 TaxID=3377725 RepID=UPI003C792804
MTNSFEEELEVFRTEEETAQQHFFAYLSVRTLAASDEGVLNNIKTTPLFWRTTHHAMLLAAFVTLGRIFDQDPKSDHNIDKLMRVTNDNLHLLTKAGLASRRVASGSMTQQQANRYAADAYDMTVQDVRDLKKQVAKWRRVYEDKYRDVRHFVFAHKKTQATVEQVLARTNVEEVKELFGFLAGLYHALDQLYLNGRRPVVEVRKFVLSPNSRSSSMSPGERVFAEGHEVLRMVTMPDPDELRYNAGMEA